MANEGRWCTLQKPRCTGHSRCGLNALSPTCQFATRPTKFPAPNQVIHQQHGPPSRLVSTMLVAPCQSNDRVHIIQRHRHLHVRHGALLLCMQRCATLQRFAGMCGHVHAFSSFTNDARWLAEMPGSFESARCRQPVERDRSRPRENETHTRACELGHEQQFADELWPRIAQATRVNWDTNAAVRGAKPNTSRAKLVCAMASTTPTHRLLRRAPRMQHQWCSTTPRPPPLAAPRTDTKHNAQTNTLTQAQRHTHTITR